MKDIALTIAGSDPSSGAGLQLDLKVFKELKVYGMAVVSSITVQNSSQVFYTQKLDGKVVYDQIVKLIEDFKIKAVKTGMLLTKDTVIAVYEALKGKNIPLIVDPIIKSSSGRTLLDNEGVVSLKEKLLPMCSIVTPNIPESEQITGIRIKSVEDIYRVYTQFKKIGIDTVLIKGGHMEDKKKVIDYLFYKDKLEILEYPRISKNKIHGTGCFLSAAITANIAKGYSVVNSVKIARAFLQYKLYETKKLGKGSFYFIL